MHNCKQTDTPLATALKNEVDCGKIPFDVPAHKGRFSQLIDYFGEKCVALDLNSRESTDDPLHPHSAIMEAESLAAELFCAKKCFFTVGGTTAAVQSMIMSYCSYGDKIILPRNVHTSVINALVLSGSIPVYVNPGINKKFGISLGMDINDTKRAIDDNTDASAILINNPTYYGVCSDLREIVEYAHERDIAVLCDEAHATALYFSDELPDGAMQCGADMSAISIHKNGGSFTQTSFLLAGKNADVNYVQNIVNLTKTSSSSYLFLASLDIARRELAMYGRQNTQRLIELCNCARKKLSEIDGIEVLSALDGEKNTCIHGIDSTKLCINTVGLGLAGIEVYHRLNTEYNIQLEYGDLCNVLAVPSYYSTKDDFDKLVNAVSDIAKKYKSELAPGFIQEYIHPVIKMSPQKAFYSKKISVPLEQSNGKISGEFVMCYPPGIPIVAPGELITSEQIRLIKYATEKGCHIISGSRITEGKIMILM